MALGAQRTAVAWMVIREAGAWALLGVAGGLAGAVGARRVVASLAPGVNGLDPVLLSAVAAVLFGVAVAACYVPAWRATRVDPVGALRAD